MSVTQPELVERLVTRTIALLETEYPNSLRVDLRSPLAGPVTPSGLHPAFYGCYDWHSAVHSVWQVVRAMRVLPDASFVEPVTAALDRLLTPANVAVETAWAADRPNFEMPYGMAWLLLLAHELRTWGDRGRTWLQALQPLEAHAVARFVAHCDRRTRPVRGGMHDQSAFSLGLAWDATGPDGSEPRRAIESAARRFFDDDTEIDLRHEPSAADFLSPALCEADLMRRVLPADEFAGWLERFAPHGFTALAPVAVVDPSDGQLAHWAGLDLGRSWMLTAVADALAPGHRMVDGLRSGAAEHAVAGLATADHDHIMVSHWVPTFAVYLLTEHPPLDVDRR